MATSEACDGDDGRVKRAGLPRHKALHRSDRRSGCHDGIGGEVRHGGMPATPLNRHLKLDGTREECAWSGGNHTRGKRWPDVHAKGCLDTV